MDESVILNLDSEAERTRRSLLRAAAVLESGGHCKGTAQDGNARCLSGAITEATIKLYEETGEDWFLYRGHDACFAWIDMPDPIGWNDAPERTKDEVVAKLRAVALGL